MERSGWSSLTVSGTERERMTDMENVISVIVVLVFAGIVFRKRLAPFFKNRSKKDTEEIVETASGDDTVSPDKEINHVYINVFGIDAGAYLNAETLADAIDAKLRKHLDNIYNTYLGSFIDYDIIINGDLLLFLIRWRT